jgi:N-acetylglucosaminyldiphosphoundecaprenol N-acetyl-beta-D-mannosaminyltransferase
VTDADDLAREVYCIAGVPIDAISMPAVLARVEAAAQRAARFLLSTPNLNFLVHSQQDADFRESLLSSDLCPADGLPIVWIAWLMGLPISRVAGSDIFDALRAPQRSARPLNVFLFGGAEGVAASACHALNAAGGGLRCVGWISPGFGSVEDMSRDDVIATINASNADFLVVALGAAKGQSWLMRNHRRLRVPIRSHMGAVMNFTAGTLKRAPLHVRQLGLEWLWRIKEEPLLWRRYWHDGGRLLRLGLTRLFPLLMWERWLRLKDHWHARDFAITRSNDAHGITLGLSGSATARSLNEAIAAFREALTTRRPVIINLSELGFIDSRFLGCLLMLRKCLQEHETPLQFTGQTPRVTRLFRLHGAEYLLSF